MMRTLVALASLCLPVLVCGPTAARSALTARFAATVLADSIILRAADGAVAAHAPGGHLSAFAHRDSVREVAAADAIAGWAAADAQAAKTAAEAPTIDHLGPVFSAFDPAFRPIPGAEPTAADAAALARLPSADGAAFDTLYLDIARPALERSEAADKDYILNGDDMTLRAFAVHDLPKVEALIAAIPRL